jgi:hypothetical protein
MVERLAARQDQMSARGSVAFDPIRFFTASNCHADLAARARRWSTGARGNPVTATPTPTTPSHFKLCTTCRKPIAFASDYYQCSVSTCNRKKTGLYFCSVPCWDAHVPVLRHRDAWAEPSRAPTIEAFLKDLAAERECPAKTKEERMSDETEQRQQIPAAPSGNPLPEDVLIVVSKLKAYVKARGAMNTSDGVTSVLSRHLRALCDKAISHAAADNRKTVMDRDFEAVLEAGTGTDSSVP